MKKLVFVLLLVLVGLTVPACGSLDRQYVEADRATFNAVAPEYLADLEQRFPGEENRDKRERRQRTVQSWELRLKRAESEGK